MQKTKLTPSELRQIRLEFAVLICKKYPNLYKKLFNDKRYVMGENEAIVSKVLAALCETEPFIKIVLDNYYFPSQKPFKAVVIKPYYTATVKA